MVSKRIANALARAAIGTKPNRNITSFFSRRPAPVAPVAAVPAPAAPAAALAVPAAPSGIEINLDEPIQPSLSSGRVTRSQAKKLDSPSDKSLVPSPPSGRSTGSRVKEIDSDDKPLVPALGRRTPKKLESSSAKSLLPTPSSGPSTRFRAKLPERDSDDETLVPPRVSVRATRSRGREPSVASGNKSGADKSPTSAPARSVPVHGNDEASPSDDEDASPSDDEDRLAFGPRYNFKKAQRFAEQVDVDKARFETTPLSDRMRAWAMGEPIDIWEPISRQPAVPGRNFIPFVLPFRDDDNVVGWELCARQNGTNLRFLSLPSADGNPYTQREAMFLCSKLVEALQVWPDINDITSPVTTGRRTVPRNGSSAIGALASAAHRVVFLNRTPIVFYAGSIVVGARKGFRLMISLLHPDTLVSSLRKK
ncbi:hypothetical protein GGTG_10041 [Gaeumannomyces tritici R3-111a-1]|uniref:Uncharacterized protein n=1 Tax=Gaeumannomyces tritici (strain R3-111a-1) TaxID=644352 RepID=J3P957_GAET3|nr:hypothetical protein GGTG_10041 [Gaeumannomyces tritici R3-111a-1]EJT73192.1 hypothetical protein GGTG_10041 [Gaeumannomyces tritici R3-111a-1]